MEGKVAEISKERKRLAHLLSSPEVMKDPLTYQKYSREYKRLGKLLSLCEQLEKVEREIKEAEGLLDKEEEGEFLSLVNSELERLRHLRKDLQEKLEDSLEDNEENRNIIMEIRAGAGGEEASLFARDLFRMYSRFAEKKGWKVEIIDSHPSDLGGFKEIVFAMEGEGAYRHLKYESGVHRVQRVPVTESGGRIHTSTVTVAVLPEAQEVEVNIAPGDLRIEVFRSSGPGGQHVNKTDSAVRIIHLPTGIVAQCQDERSQQKNKVKAMRVLRSRLLDRMKKEKEEFISQSRRSQIGSGERSEKIRTYNFPQKRVTDHRIGLSLHNLEEVLEGELDKLIQALRKQGVKVH